MVVIVGLQNPGEAYENTRHNAGAIAVRAFCAAYHLPEFVTSAAYVGELSEGVVDGQEVRLLLPTTFMNASGGAVKKAMLGAPHGTLVVAYDDLDLPVGQFKLSFGRGSGGHNGVQSVIDALGSKDFIRVRIGISPTSFFGTLKRPSSEHVSKFVLQNFSKRERAKLEAVIPDITRAIHTVVTEGKEKAMSLFN